MVVTDRACRTVPGVVSDGSFKRRLWLGLKGEIYGLRFATRANRIS